MIDSHIHFWKYNPIEFPWMTGDLSVIAKDMSPEDLLAQLPAKIEGLIAVQARPSWQENEYLNGLAEQHSIIKGIVAWFDFEKDAQMQLEKFIQNKRIKGFRHMIQDEPDPTAYMLNNHQFNVGVEKIQQAELLYGVLIHQKDLHAAVKFSQRHDQYALVIDHLAKPQMYSSDGFTVWKKRMKELAALAHVNCKISGLVTEAGAHCKAQDFQAYLDIALELFGPERLLWGSDWPVSLATQRYETLLVFWDEWTRNWSASERKQVETDTPKRLYKL
ncbi:amidohydrolase family protein [Acinetobacter nematophilus]|uniref:Amidohydrolase family protein n=1 Tax=Acinetobacter nematophilus TaxID=2994642 RepID=A0A9X3IH11_9GAMM|nr:amidohydrolase family protein [Acinetobacter nematophilus]